jgi:hypothetical protein
VSVAVGPIFGLLTPAAATDSNDGSDLDEDHDQISLDDLEDEDDESPQRNGPSS